MCWRIVSHVLFVLGLAILGWVGLLAVVPPTPPLKVEPREFDVERALEHVRAIAQRPHPAGSEENRRVRQYILEQLRKLEMDPRVHTRTIGGRDEVEIHNIFARLRADTSVKRREAILLCAHYDSVRAGPGAADDAAAVAAILETIRALRSGPAMRRDVAVLLTDGEEMGLLGARAFLDGWNAQNVSGAAGQRSADRSPDETRRSDGYVERAAFLADVALVLNFEARGTSGPSIMFETSPGNLELVRHFASAAPNPVGSSLSYDVYRMMPNNTDFTVFRHAGMRGLNFAFIGDPQNYHTADDSVENLDRRSLYHHGQNALALVRYWGEPDSPMNAGMLRSRSDAVYFNVGRAMVVYSQGWTWGLTAVQLALLGMAWWYVKRAVRWERLGVGLVIVLGSLAIGMSGVLAVVKWVPDGQLLDYRVMLMTVSILVPIAVVGAAWLMRRGRQLELAMGAVVLLAMLAVPVNLYVPGASYLIAWPGIFAAVGLCWAVDGTREKDASTGPRPAASGWIQRTVIAVVATAPVMLLAPSVIYLALLALGPLRMPLVAAAPGLYTWVLLSAASAHLTPRGKC